MSLGIFVLVNTVRSLRIFLAGISSHTLQYRCILGNQALNIRSFSNHHLGIGEQRRAEASKCGLGSIPGLGAIRGLSLLLVLVLAPRGFSPGTPVFPSPQKPTFLNSSSIWTQWTKSHLVDARTANFHLFPISL